MSGSPRLHFDVYERHKAVDLLLGQMVCDLVLDVGGTARSLAPFLGQSKIVALNVDGTGHVWYSGAVFPFAGRAFDVVVSLDTLEHVPRQHRLPFAAECARVAKRAVLIVAPFGTREHARYEAELDELFYEVQGQRNRWLHEHVVCGLPDEGEVTELRRLMSDLGFSTRVLYAGDWLWRCRDLKWRLRQEHQPDERPKLRRWLRTRAAKALGGPIGFSETPYQTANRFYLLAERVGQQGVA